MALVMTSIGDRGELANERTGLSVTANCDLKTFLLFRTNFLENAFYNISTAAYWFPPENVKKGDRVVVYTKAGTNSLMNNPDGTTTYFAYWGLDSPIYINPKHGIVLARVSDWSLSANL